MRVYGSPSWQSVRLEQLVSNQLDAVVELLTTTRQSLELVARGLAVDAEEVADALANAEPDTAEYVALSVLAKLNP